MQYLNDRLEANAILDRITDDSTDTASREDVNRLIELLPINEAKKFVFRVIKQNNNTKTTAYSPGAGNVSIENKDNKKIYTNQNEPIRIGGYKLWHKFGAIEIHHIWEDTKLLENVPSLLIEYNKQTKQAESLNITKFRGLNLFIISFSFSTYVEWKSLV